LRLTAVDPLQAPLAEPVRVLTPAIAELTRLTMRGVAMAAERKVVDKDAIPLKYEMFGKSGTADIPLGKPPAGKKRPRGMKGYYVNQYYSSFVAAAPADDPRLVVLVVIDDPGPEAVRTRHHYGSYAAYPVARGILERGLEYLGVEPSVRVEEGEPPAGDAGRAKPSRAGR
ncbi:MAG: hypothetical protein H7Y88_06330, partial [Phycisphaerales bacterium]|nr:hypothetical protein [Phycisphaerales bacterium]